MRHRRRQRRPVARSSCRSRLPGRGRCGHGIAGRGRSSRVPRGGRRRRQRSVARTRVRREEYASHRGGLVTIPRSPSAGSPSGGRIRRRGRRTVPGTASLLPTGRVLLRIRKAVVAHERTRRRLRRHRLDVTSRGRFPLRRQCGPEVGDLSAQVRNLARERRGLVCMSAAGARRLILSCHRTIVAHEPRPTTSASCLSVARKRQLVEYRRAMATMKRSQLDALVAAATVDCYNDDEQVTGLYTLMEDHLCVPFETRAGCRSDSQGNRPNGRWRDRGHLRQRQDTTAHPDPRSTSAGAGTGRRQVGRRLSALAALGKAFR